MKKKLLFTFACVMALMAGFVSCTNDDFEEFAPVAEMQKSAMTRAAGGMTQEEVQARLDELGEKYGINIKMLYVRDYSEFTESTFEKMEQDIIAYKNKEVNTTAVSAMAVDDNFLDDGVIDEYEIATLSTNAEPDDDSNPNSGFVLDLDVEYTVPSEYSSDSTSVISTQTDCYSYKYTVNLRSLAITGDFVIESYYENLSPAVNKLGQAPKSVCQMGGLRHGPIGCKYPGNCYFDFEFNIYAFYILCRPYPDKDMKITTDVYVRGAYDDGVEYVWVTEPDKNIVVNYSY